MRVFLYFYIYSSRIIATTWLVTRAYAGNKYQDQDRLHQHRTQRNKTWDSCRPRAFMMLATYGSKSATPPTRGTCNERNCEPNLHTNDSAPGDEMNKIIINSPRRDANL